MPDIEKVKYAVEANSYERQSLWEKWHTRVKWEQISMGKMPTIGNIGKFPVCVELYWNILNGHKILFYSACSRVVDHQMVEDWIKENALVPGAEMTNADNFGNIVNYLPK